MQTARMVLRSTVVLALAGSIGAPLSASTFIRASLEQLVKRNTTIVVGEVRDAKSYWNEEEGFILTDVRIRATEVLKGDPMDNDFTITFLGGTVGDTTTVLTGGPELIPGKAYVLFLRDVVLKNGEGVRIVPAHAQGVFDIVRARDGLWAISQAHRVPLVPDALGLVEPPGKAQGIPLHSMIRSIREIAAREGARREVK